MMKLGRPGGSRRRGFSLLEVLVVLALFGILAAAGVPAFLNYVKNFRLRAAANTLVSDLNLARQKAVTMNRDVYVFFRPSLAGTLNTGYDWNPDYDVVVSDLENGMDVPGVDPESLKGWPVEALSADFVRVSGGKPSTDDLPGSTAPGGTEFPDESLEDIEAKSLAGGVTTYDYADIPAVIFRPNGSVETPGTVWVVLEDSLRGTRFGWYEIDISSVGKINITGVDPG